MAVRRRTGSLLLACLASLALREAFVPQGVSRSFWRALPGLSLAGFAAPSWADKGVTKPWSKRPDGGEDEIHVGGVEWEDVKVGTGASPQIGDQIGLRYTLKAFVREREVVVEDIKDKAKDFRFGVGQLLPGMDEGIQGMKTGGVRKMRIPGNLAFGERGLPSAPGRMALPPFQPVEATVTLDFIPGADSVYDYGSQDDA
ncbi:unnamed protein product [Effrenium voratum]|uniref:peptidylprolyl isomerase n=1 Tax=Effrenium voratum TaxID=2562239 RepID=A0AA36J049_9DINO|nr:unnamed protein product [Effrenium voratum]CAJ1444545.1 unnamed protein product [Effrenium voratum]